MEMTANDIPGIATGLLTEHGMTKLGWVFRWDNAKLRAGSCRYRSKTITLSRHYVAMNVADRPDDVLDTILHEVAHAMVGGGKGHGPEWKAACVKIGARPNRCYDATSIAMPRGSLTATCGGCLRVFSRHRALKKYRAVHCAACGPDSGKLEFKCTEVAAPPPPPPRVAGTPPAAKKLRGI